MENIVDVIRRDEKKQCEDKRNMLIAEKIRQVLKTKMLINQNILARENSYGTISYDKFMGLLEHFKERLSTAEKYCCEDIEKEYQDFLKQYENKVILKEHEIDQLLAYVKSSIMRFGIPQNQEEYTSNSLVKYVLLMLDDFIRECYGEEDKELGTWIDFICSRENAGFYDKTSEIYRLNGEGEEYFTISDYHKKIYAIDVDGEISINEHVDFSNVLYRDDLYLGSISLNGERRLTILSKRDGSFYPVFFDKECGNYSEEFERRLNLNAKAFIPLSSALKHYGMPQLIEPLYDKLMLEYVALAMNDKEFDTFDLSFATNNIEPFNEDIAADDLYLYYVKVANKRECGIMHKGKDTIVENSDDRLLIKLNDALELLRLNYLVEKSYDYRKLEYILMSISEGKMPKIVIDEKTPNVNLQKC